jgi:hypothetical protein
MLHVTRIPRTRFEGNRMAPDVEAKRTMMEWVLGPVAGVASGFFAAGRHAASQGDLKRRVAALEQARHDEAVTINAKIDAVRSELRADMKEMRAELRDDIRELKGMVGRIVGGPP